MPVAYLSLGSNIDREKNIAAGLKTLREYFGELTVSSVYESEPVGFAGELFYNLVVSFESTLNVEQLCQTLRQIEIKHGRTANAQKFSPRTLDLDLILFGDLIVQDGKLQLPRADIEKYAFVLEPLAEIAPTLKHLISRKTYAELWQTFDKKNVNQQRVRHFYG